jgi:sugar/nucleoside kinase (ribokinase family)
MNETFDVVTALDTCVDLILLTGNQEPEFGQKEKLIDDYFIEIGGSTAIFACQAAKLGLRTAGLGVVGEDFLGSMIVDKLRDAGVVTDGYVTRDGTLKTGFGTAIAKRGGDRAILTYTGTIDALRPEDLSSPAMRGTRHIHVGSYFLMKGIRAAWHSVLSDTKARHVTVSLDTNWDPDELWDGGVRDLLPFIDVFLPNVNEIKAITGKARLEPAVESLANIVPTIAVKMGEQGADAWSGGARVHCDAILGDVVDTIGAGDSFDAGFLFGYLRGFSTAQCLRMACACGSLTTRKAGGIAGQPRLSELESLLGRLS